MIFIGLLYIFTWGPEVVLYFVLPAVILTGFYFYTNHLDNVGAHEKKQHIKENPIPFHDNQLSVFRYIPFYQKKPNPKLAHLDSEATLSLSENLPQIDCATAFYPIAAAFVEATYPSNQNYDPFGENPKSVLQVNKTPLAYENLILRKVDIIFALAPSSEQLRYAKEQGVELVLTPIGKEGFVFFVNAKNPVESLTLDEIRQIYSGELTHWQILGGNNQNIKAFQRDENSGSQTALQHLMKGYPIMTPPLEDRLQEMENMIQTTARYQNVDSALGFSFRFFPAKWSITSKSNYSK